MRASDAAEEKSPVNLRIRARLKTVQKAWA